MEDSKKQYADIVVQYNLPENWENETTFSFDHLSDMVTQLHNSAYTASVKAINRFCYCQKLCHRILYCRVRATWQ